MALLPVLRLDELITTPVLEEGEKTFYRLNLNVDLKRLRVRLVFNIDEVDLDLRIGVPGLNGDYEWLDWSEGLEEREEVRLEEPDKRQYIIRIKCFSGKGSGNLKAISVHYTEDEIETIVETAEEEIIVPIEEGITQTEELISYIDNNILSSIITLADSLNSMTNDMEDSIFSSITGIASDVESTYYEMENTIMGSISAIASDLTNTIDTVENTIGDVIGTGLEKVESGLSSMENSVIEYLNKLLDKVEDLLKEAWDNLKEVLLEVLDYFASKIWAALFGLIFEEVPEKPT